MKDIKWEHANEPDENPRMVGVDWKEKPYAVLEAVDRQLEEYGLEIVMVDHGSDSYEWTIEKREPRT